MWHLALIMLLATISSCTTMKGLVFSNQAEFDAAENLIKQKRFKDAIDAINQSKENRLIISSKSTKVTETFTRISISKDTLISVIKKMELGLRDPNCANSSIRLEYLQCFNSQVEEKIKSVSAMNNPFNFDITELVHEKFDTQLEQNQLEIDSLLSKQKMIAREESNYKIKSIEKKHGKKFCEFTEVNALVSGGATRIFEKDCLFIMYNFKVMQVVDSGVLLTTNLPYPLHEFQEWLVYGKIDSPSESLVDGTIMPPLLATNVGRFQYSTMIGMKTIPAFKILGTMRDELSD